MEILMQQLLSYILPYVQFVRNALVNYNGKITDTGTQILWGAVLFFALLWAILHLVKRKKSSASESSTLSLAKKAGRLSKIGDYLNAAKLYEKAGNLQLAADAYYQAGTVYYAAQIYKRLGMKDKQASALEQIGFHKEAGELYRELSMYKQAGENLLQSGELLKAANMLETTGETEKAADTYMAAGFNLRAGELYTKLDDKAKIASAYEASIIIPKGDTIPRAITNYAMRAIPAYISTGNVQKAAEVAEKAGLKKYAAELYSKLENWAKASELYLSANDKKSAADVMEKAGWHERASGIRASYYEENGKKREAIQIYEKIGRFDDAARLYASIGEKMKAAELYASAGKHIVSASIYREIGYIDKAISILDAATESDKQSGEAQVLRLDLLMEKGMYKDAGGLVEQMISGKTLSESNLQLYYKLANIYEEEGRAKDATIIYNKIVKIDPAG